MTKKIVAIPDGWNGPSPSDVREAISDIVALRGDYDTTKMALASGYKTIKKLGISRKALDTVIGMKKQDIGRVAEYRRTLLFYMDCAGLKEQLDLFEQKVASGDED